MKTCFAARFVALLICFVAATWARAQVPDWEEMDDQFHEQTTVMSFDPGVSVTLNVVADAKPRALVIYALPNGNTTPQTIGKHRAAGDSWRFDIQHIGAQTRALRSRCPEYADLAVAYLEADTRSWPAWRGRQKDAGDARIREIVEELRARLDHPNVILTGHSGGGSFTFGFLNAHDAIPEYVKRIAFLDSNYAYDDEEKHHGEKLVTWLKTSPQNQLVVLAYDDRNIELDGKKVVSETGGTWRASHRMLAYMREPLGLSEDRWQDYVTYKAPQTTFMLHRNPQNKILHTALVGDKNGYIHALTIRTPCEGKVAEFDGPRGYEEFIGGIAENPNEPLIPPNSAELGGAAFIEKVQSLNAAAREEAILEQLITGNIPDYQRSFVTIEVTGAGIEGTTHTLQYYVMPDYLAVGTDEDFVRMPMNPHTAQAFMDQHGLVFPTAKMVDDIWKDAPEKLEPQPLTSEREAATTFMQHHQIIEGQRTSASRQLIAGIKKDVVVTNRLGEKPNRVAIYGWHYTNGTPIQPVTIVHHDKYVDYSHGIRPVQRMMKADGKMLPYEDILADPHLSFLLSGEGEIKTPRYEHAAQTNPQ